MHGDWTSVQRENSEKLVKVARPRLKRALAWKVCLQALTEEGGISKTWPFRTINQKAPVKCSRQVVWTVLRSAPVCLAQWSLCDRRPITTMTTEALNQGPRSLVIEPVLWRDLVVERSMAKQCHVLTSSSSQRTSTDCTWQVARGA